MSNINRFRDFFYGQANHYSHPGWYFDNIVNDLEDLSTQMNILAGRFILVSDYGAIFMRAESNYVFVTPFKSSDNLKYYYQDLYNLSGKEVPFTQVEVEGDPSILENWILSLQPDISQDDLATLIDQIQVTSGYRFISYTNPNVQIWFGGTGYIVTDFSNTDYQIESELSSEILDIFTEE